MAFVIYQSVILLLIGFFFYKLHSAKSNHEKKTGFINNGYSYWRRNGKHRNFFFVLQIRCKRSGFYEGRYQFVR